MEKFSILAVITALAATALAGPVGIVNANELSAISVPEPATLLLLAFGGLALNVKLR